MASQLMYKWNTSRICLNEMTTNEQSDFPSSSILKEAFKHHLKEPVVFRNRLNSWNRVPRTPEQLTDKYGKITLSFRLVSRTYKDISWEGSAMYIEATVKQYFDWQNGPVQKPNPFVQFKYQDVWAYSGYNHLIQTFGEYEDIVQAVDWSSFGYYETPGKDSAFWLGTEGSYTPCHYDTYGSNLVAQIQGRKKWTLFPPEDTPFMYPTRIPYEESSVFSSVNILNPDFKIHPLFRLSHPYVVTLEPGDVLFVPHKWWHFVQCLDSSFSINTWMKMDSDNDTHLEEAVARALMTSLISYFEPEGESWLNAHEELVAPEETLKYISTGLHKIENAKNVQKKPESKRNHVKAAKTLPKSDVHSDNSGNSHPKLLHKDIIHLTSTLFSEWYGKNIEVPSDLPQNVNRKKIVDCFSHPEVISAVCKLLKNM